MSTTSTPLRYPGGKSRLARFFSFLLRHNGISDCTYVEPFAGGAGAAINLLRKEYVRVLYLNDIDPGTVISLTFPGPHRQLSWVSQSSS
jgi:DNA adenine methylase